MWELLGRLDTSALRTGAVTTADCRTGQRTLERLSRSGLELVKGERGAVDKVREALPLECVTIETLLGKVAPRFHNFHVSLSLSRWGESRWRLLTRSRDLGDMR